VCSIVAVSQWIVDLRSALALLLVSLSIIFSHPCAIHVGPLTYSLDFAPPAKINNHPSIVIINTIEFSIKKRIVIVAQTSFSRLSRFFRISRHFNLPKWACRKIQPPSFLLRC
jgi:hypothetical protein